MKPILIYLISLLILNLITQRHCSPEVFEKVCAFTVGMSAYVGSVVWMMNTKLKE